MNLNDFFAVIYELLGYAGTFSDDIYQEELYTSVGLINIFVGLFLTIVFYFFNRPKFSKLKYWLFMLLISFIINFVVGILVTQNTLTALGLEYKFIDYALFGLKNAVICIIVFVIWSYAFKWWNSDTKGIPKIFFGKF